MNRDELIEEMELVCPSDPSTWVWLPHAAHFIGSNSCRFHLATYLPNGYIVSTIGDYFPMDEEQEEVGIGILYETMVFHAKEDDTLLCCGFGIEDYDNVDFDGYTKPKEAREGHMKMCMKWSQRESA